MRNLTLIIYLLFFVSTISYSQITNKKELLLIKTARYIYIQQHTFNKIKLNFPEQKAAIENAELAFNNTFGAAITRINADSKNLLGKKYDAFLTNINNELNENSMTDIKNSLRRPSIESPVLETLLTYKYQNNPINEFWDNYVNIYSVKSYSNSRKINLNLKVPLSWKELDGTSPTMLKKFRSEFGTGNVIITLRTKKLSKVSFIKDVASTENEQQKDELENSITIAIKNNSPARISQYDQTNPKPSSIQKRYIIEHLFLSENNVLEVKCTISASTNSELDLQYQKFNPLYKSIVKSIRIIKPFENNSLHTSTKRKL